MKYLKLEDNKLYTPIFQYRNNDKVITSIGAIHLGQGQYYDKLQKTLDSISEGFFEGIKPLIGEDKIPDEKKQYIDGIKKLSILYETVAKCLGMETQKSKLKYPENWKNPDMTLDELIIVSPEKVLKKLFVLDKSLDFIEKSYKKHPEEFKKVVQSIAWFTFKFPLLSHWFSVLQNGPMFYKVILDKRNQKLFDAMKPKLKEEFSELGIIYGAAHLNGIDKFLRRNGFKNEGRVWIPAWEFNSELSFWRSLKTLAKDGLK